MKDFCDLLGTPYAPVSKIAPVKVNLILIFRIEEDHCVKKILST